MEKMKIEYPDESTEISASCVNPTPGRSDDHAPVHSDAHTQITAEGEEEKRECAPLISVIVPIYNVEKCVRKCLDSLRGQTMKQIEVICIDDGSTDRSGLIADEYKTSPGVWPVFRVIHTENRGLSAARNRGIDESRSEWLMFVDSDDWVDSKFCEVPYNAALENGADMVIFQADEIKHGRVWKRRKTDIPKGIVDEFTAHEYGGAAAWNKLYNKSLLETIRYPIGRVYEDVATTHKIVHESKRTLILSKCLYNYVLRKGSISRTRSIDNKRDGFIYATQRRDNLISYGYPVEKLKNALCSSAIGYISVVTPCDDELYLEARTIMESTKGIPKNLRTNQKIGLIMWKINPALFHLLCMIDRVGITVLGMYINNQLAFDNE